MSTNDQKPHIESIWNTHAYINEYIRFADQKASMLIGVNSAVIGAMVWSELDDIPFGFTLNFVTLVITICLLLASFSFAWFAIYPRLGMVIRLKGQAEVSSLSPVFFEDIRSKKKIDYTNYVASLSENGWAHAIAEHCWELSEKVAHKKFFWIGISARLWLVASVLALVLIAVNH